MSLIKLFCLLIIMMTFCYAEQLNDHAFAHAVKESNEIAIETHLEVAKAFVQENTATLTEEHKKYIEELHNNFKKLSPLKKQEVLSAVNKNNKSSKGCVVQKGTQSDCSKNTLTDQEEDIEQDNNTLFNKGEEFLIFVSFSMPVQNIKQLLQSAKSHGGTVVIRGLIEDSFVKTGNRIQELGEALTINPELFKEYAIQVVPTFVLKTSKGYSKIAGNISPAYAYQQLKDGM